MVSLMVGSQLSTHPPPSPPPLPPKVQEARGSLGRVQSDVEMVVDCSERLTLEFTPNVKFMINSTFGVNSNVRRSLQSTTVSTSDVSSCTYAVQIQ